MTSGPKSYPASWEGELVLACRKCQKKLKGHDRLRGLAKLKKTVKRHNKEHPDQLLHVMNVPCMDLCPKDAVTVCCPERDAKLLRVLRDEKDLYSLLPPG